MTKNYQTLLSVPKLTEHISTVKWLHTLFVAKLKTDYAYATVVSENNKTINMQGHLLRSSKKSTMNQSCIKKVRLQKFDSTESL